jgi:hypothetical protein
MSSGAQCNGEFSESRHERSASARGAKDWGGEGPAKQEPGGSTLPPQTQKPTTLASWVGVHVVVTLATSQRRIEMLIRRPKDARVVMTLEPP